MTTTNGTAPPATTAAGDKLDWLLGDITGGHPTSRPNPEVAARAKRRRFTAEYKEKVLAQADAARGSGEIGALLRREGLYFSLLATWRREREAAIRKGLSPQKRGPKPQTSPEALENQKLQRENERLTEHLRKSSDGDRHSKKSGCSAGPGAAGNGDAVMAGLGELIPVVGVKQACAALNIPRASFYRKKILEGSPAWPAARRPAPARSLVPAEREKVLAHLHEERFQNASPAAVYATLLDEGEYHCSIRTM
jgi:transposase-like protein